MSNHPFSKYGIEHLSCSSLNLWRASPGIWALRYIAKMKDKGNAAMWRGSAVENGLAAMLRGTQVDVAASISHQAFDLNSSGELTEDNEGERDLIEPMLKQCVGWKPPSNLSATQIKVEHWFDEIPIPLIGYLDFSFEDGTDVDLKTTKACPSNPRADHVRQVSLYRAARKRKGGLLYVTGKRWSYFNIDDDQMKRALGDLQSDALCLLNFLSRFDGKESVMRALPIDWDSFYAPKTKIPLAEILMAG